MTRVVHTRPVLGLLAADPSDADELSWGPLAGRVGWQPVDEWKRSEDHALHLVIAEDLRRCRDPSLRHPIACVDADDAPHTHALLRAMPALAVHESLSGPLAQRGCRLLRMAYHRVDEQLFIATAGPGWPARELELLRGDLFGRDAIAIHPLEMIDRLLCAMTGGLVGELALRAADLVAQQIDATLVEDGGPTRLAKELREREELRRALGPEDFERWCGEESGALADLSGREEAAEEAASWGAHAREIVEALVRQLERGGGPDLIVLEHPPERRPAGALVAARERRYRVERRPGTTLRLRSGAGLEVPPAVVARAER